LLFIELKGSVLTHLLWN